ncbi:MAG: helix-turn-helix domain-containing protein [Candidatus Choladocola sp.]|nr:helix-turn-helix domain-containing protein [Candidatus Choladocola sp.]
MIRYKFNVMEQLKQKGYSSKRLRDEKLMGESYMTQLRRGDLVSWKTIDTICMLLGCQVGDLVEYVKEEGSEASE